MTLVGFPGATVNDSRAHSALLLSVSVVMPCDETKVVAPDDRDTRLAPGMPPACQLRELMGPNVGGGRSGDRGPSAARYSYSLTLIGTSIT